MKLRGPSMVISVCVVLYNMRDGPHLLCIHVYCIQLSSSVVRGMSMSVVLG